MKHAPQPERDISPAALDARLLRLECAFEEAFKGASLYFAVKEFEKHGPPVD